MITLIGLHVESLNRFTHSHQPGLSIVTALIYQQILILAALVSAAVPALNRGLRKFHTGMGGTWMSTTLTEGRSSERNNRSGGGSFPLQSLDKHQGRRQRTLDRSFTGEETFRPDDVQYSTFSGRRDPRRADVDGRSDQSQESQASDARIIRKDVEFNVHYEDAQA
jgi:hypothetical protein